MANKHGDFIWYELMTSDADAAQNFYAGILGWTFADSGQEDMDYRVISANGVAVGGLLPITEEMQADGARPCWMGYIGVDDVDASAAEIESAGGKIHMQPKDIPGVGRFAFVNDPQGVMFYIMRAASDETSEAFAAEAPRVGHCAWNELATSDPAAALDFYSSQFGWKKDGDMDMGPLGKYEFLRNDFMLGAVMPKPEEMPIPMWSYYFRVPDIDTAVEQIKAGGGQVCHGPDEIPGDEFSLSGMDPQGAMFALVGPRGK